MCFRTARSVFGIMAAWSLVLAAVVALAAAESPSAKHARELKEHFDHLAYIAQFPCLEPQPRAILVDDIFPPEVLKEKAFFPDLTILHRCHDCAGIGYCTEGQRCAPVVMETVRLPFKATFLHDTPTAKKGSWNLEYYWLTNHTACGCSENYNFELPTHHVVPSGEHNDVSGSQ